MYREGSVRLLQQDEFLHPAAAERDGNHQAVQVDQCQLRIVFQIDVVQAVAVKIPDQRDVFVIESMLCAGAACEQA